MRKILCLLILVSFILVSCGSGDEHSSFYSNEKLEEITEEIKKEEEEKVQEEEEKEQEEDQRIEEIDSQMKLLSSPQADPNEVGVTDCGDAGEEKPEDPEYYTCTAKKYSASAVYNEYINLNPHSDIIYLGSLIDGGSIDDGRYTPITAKRAPMTFSLSHQSINSIGYVDEVKLSHVRHEFNRIISQENIGSSVSDMSFEVKEVFSEEQARPCLENCIPS